VLAGRFADMAFCFMVRLEVPGVLEQEIGPLLLFPFDPCTHKKDAAVGERMFLGK
jgi:hypothetical protein